ncbi:hypothetical protein N665_0302s0015 [Sinapis alba]|nr:hypothetical protein N665_0302s0015 [Sinapis alba]
MAMAATPTVSFSFSGIITSSSFSCSTISSYPKEEVETEDFAELAKKLENASPLEIMDKALETFENDITIAFSGAEDVALVEYGRLYRVFGLDTGILMEKHYGIRIEYMFLDSVEFQGLVSNKGLSLYMRMVRPWRRALKGFRAWITGQRKDQSPGTRSEILVVQVDPVFEGLDGGAGSLVKWNLVANFQGDHVWSFLRTMDVPVNTLHAAGCYDQQIYPHSLQVPNPSLNHFHSPHEVSSTSYSSSSSLYLFSQPMELSQSNLSWSLKILLLKHFHMSLCESPHPTITHDSRSYPPSLSLAGLHKGNIKNDDGKGNNVSWDSKAVVEVIFKSESLVTLSRQGVENLMKLENIKDPWIVVLYGPWCPFCQAAPWKSYDELADKLGGRGVKKKFAKQEFQLGSFPMILVFPKNSSRQIKDPSEKRDVDS